MKYRTRTEIFSVILNTASGGATKTKIMYHAFLSHAQLKEYLSVLTENNLLNYDAYTRTFKTTEKGLRFIEIYNHMSGVIKTHRQQYQEQKVW